MFDLPWWERHRQVLEEEEADLRDLADNGDIALDEVLLDQGQVRAYTLAHSVNGETFDLRVVFSDYHPYFRPTVQAEQRPGVHQNPFSGELCLVQGDTWLWDTEETVASMIRQQLPALLKDRPAGSAPAAAGGGEHVEPYVNYYEYAPLAAIRVPDTTEGLRDVEAGVAVVALDAQVEPGAIRGTLLSVRGKADGLEIWKAPEDVLRLHDNGGEVKGVLVPFVRLQAHPAHSDAASVQRDIRAAMPARLAVGPFTVNDFEMSAVAGVFEDSRRPNESGDAWLFVFEGRGPQPAARRPPKRGGKLGKSGAGRTTPQRETLKPYLARTFAVDRRAMTERVPSLSSLADKRVVVMGVGGVGAPLAIELAKAGVGDLDLVDWDTLNPGNAPRWPLGYQAAGYPKSLLLADHINRHWPYTTARPFGWKVGGPRTASLTNPDWADFYNVIRDADLVVDATAEVGVTYFLSDLTRELRLPLIIASTTEGGWGGRIARLSGDGTGPCWSCIRHHAEDETPAAPPADPDAATGNVHPAGCTTTTFTAAGFDVSTVSMGAARLAASVLTAGADPAYPPADWNVATYEFRDKTSARAGSAEEHQVDRHPDCQSCTNRSSG